MDRWEKNPGRRDDSHVAVSSHPVWCSKNVWISVGLLNIWKQVSLSCSVGATLKKVILCVNDSTNRGSSWDREQKEIKLKSDISYQHGQELGMSLTKSLKEPTST